MTCPNHALPPVSQSAAGVILGLYTLCAAPCLALPLDFAAPVQDSARESATLTSYAMPVGPFADGTLPTLDAEGAFEQLSYKLDAPDLTTLELLAPLRAQLLAQGFRVVFECEAFGCGGYDFRFGTRVMAEPDMHVDLGDFRYLAATRDAEVVSLIVSRSALAGFVQVTRVFPPEAQPLDTALSSKSAEQPAAVAVPESPLDAIAKGEAVVIAGLDFASGAAVLDPGSAPALAELAAWLAANPDLSVTLRGYTDASGPLAANVALSRARAEAVKAALVTGHGIAAARLTADGMGPENPLADNATAEGRRINRRVEVSLTSTPAVP